MIDIYGVRIRMRGQRRREKSENEVMSDDFHFVIWLKLGFRV